MKTPVRHVMLLEELGVAATLAPLLTEAGWTVRACTSVREAIYTAKRHQVDALIVALHLPDERGDVAYYRIAAQYPRVRSKTVFLVQTPHDERLIGAIGGRPMRLPAPAQAIRDALYEACGIPLERESST